MLRRWLVCVAGLLIVLSAWQVLSGLLSLRSAQSELRPTNVLKMPAPTPAQVTKSRPSPSATGTNDAASSATTQSTSPGAATSTSQAGTVVGGEQVPAARTPTMPPRMYPLPGTPAVHHRCSQCPLLRQLGLRSRTTNGRRLLSLGHTSTFHRRVAACREGFGYCSQQFCYSPSANCCHEFAQG